MTIVVIVLVLVGGVGVWWWAAGPPPHTTKDLTIEVGGKEPAKLDARLYLPESRPAPAVLLAHGFGATKESMNEQAEKLAAQGYVVLTYTARGFGKSTGSIHLNAPDYEVADAGAMLDYLAGRDEVRQDGGNDPRVAAVGGSYGGALSLLLAGYDDRVDAIVPQITWNSLADSLFPNGNGDGDGVFKQAWAGAFYANGLGVGAVDGPVPDDRRPPDTDPACGRWAAEVCEMYRNIAETGRIDADAKQLLDASSPESVLDRIKAPTLLVQGQADTLFDLGQANANAEGITNAPVKVAWYSGGHDATGTQSDQNHVDVLTGQWLDHYLKGEDAEPDGSFTYSRISGVTSSSTDLSTLGMTMPQYPGLNGDAKPVTEGLRDRGSPKIASPPGGSPAAISSLPSLGQLASLPGTGLTREVPGQNTSAETAAFGDDPVDIVGAPKVRMKVASSSGEAVLAVWPPRPVIPPSPYAH